MALGGQLRSIVSLVLCVPSLGFGAPVSARTALETVVEDAHKFVQLLLQGLRALLIVGLCRLQDQSSGAGRGW